MKQIKVTIQKEEICTEGEIFQEVSTMPLLMTIPKGDYVPQIMRIEENKITYQRMKIYNPETKEIISYYVRLDEKDLFSDLVKVTDAFILEKTKKQAEDLREYYEGIEIPKRERWASLHGEQNAKRQLQRLSFIKKIQWIFNLY